MAEGAQGEWPNLHMPWWDPVDGMPQTPDVWNMTLEKTTQGSLAHSGMIEGSLNPQAIVHESFP